MKRIDVYPNASYGTLKVDGTITDSENAQLVFKGYGDNVTDTLRVRVVVGGLVLCTGTSFTASGGNAVVSVSTQTDAVKELAKISRGPAQVGVDVVLDDPNADTAALRGRSVVLLNWSDAPEGGGGGSSVGAVESVNGKTGVVVIGMADIDGLAASLAAKQAKLTAGSNITISAENVISSTGGGAVSSVNGKTGAVVLTAADINLVPGTTVQNSVMTHHTNYQNPHGVTAAQVGARPSDWMPSAADIGALTQDAADGRYVSTSDSRLTDARTPTAHKASHISGDDKITAEEIGAAAASHTHTTSQITDFGGPYLPTYGGSVDGNLNVSQGITAGSPGEYGISIQPGLQPFISIGSVNAATEDQVTAARGLAAYTISATTGALADRTINTSSSGGTFTFPTRTGTASRDFVVSIEASATAPTVSFPATVSYVSDDSSVWTAEAGKTNVWYFSEVLEDVFMVAHKALDSVSQS